MSEVSQVVVWLASVVEEVSKLEDLKTAGFACFSGALDKLGYRREIGCSREHNPRAFESTTRLRDALNVQWSELGTGGLALAHNAAPVAKSENVDLDWSLASGAIARGMRRKEHTWNAA